MTANEPDLLERLRAHPHFGAVVGNIVVDLIDGLNDEEYEGESDERREAYQLLHELLTGKRYEAPVYVSEPDADDPAAHYHGHLRLVTP